MPLGGQRKEQLGRTREQHRATKIDKGPMFHPLALAQPGIKRGGRAGIAPLQAEGQVGLIDIPCGDKVLHLRKGGLILVKVPVRCQLRKACIPRRVRETVRLGCVKHPEAQQGQPTLRRHQIAQLVRAEVPQLITRIARKPCAARLRRLKGCEGCGHLCRGLGADDPLWCAKSRAVPQRASVKEDARTSHPRP